MKRVAVFWLSVFHIFIVSAERDNVLLIIADDLRPALGCYADLRKPWEFANTPNLDRLAAQGVQFNQAFAQQSICAVSRSSFLLGRRPDSIRIFSNRGVQYWRDTHNMTTLPEYLKHHGYHTASAGKVFHPGRVSNNTDDFPYSWSAKPFHPKTQKYKNAKVCPSTTSTVLHTNLVCPVNVTAQPSATLPDLETVAFAKTFLSSNQQRPFFLAVGLHKPHIPLKYPQQFLAKCPLSRISLAPNRHRPEDLPSIAWNPWLDVKQRDDIVHLNITFPYGEMPEQMALRVRQSYCAATAYIDSLIGELLKTLENTGLQRNTWVLFTSDHGWSLGEHGLWSKYSNFGVALRVPLIVRKPVRTAARPKFREGRKVNAIVELVDLFPSLAELLGRFWQETSQLG